MWTDLVKNGAYFEKREEEGNVKNDKQVEDETKNNNDKPYNQKIKTVDIPKGS